MKDRRKKLYCFAICGIAILAGIWILMIFIKQESQITSLSDSYYTSCYTNKRGELFVQGINTDGQLGTISNRTDDFQKIETTTRVKKAVLSLSSLSYIDENSHVFIMGIYARDEQHHILSTDKPMQVSGLSDIVDIKAGATHFLALDKFGNVWGWGENECHQVSADDSVNTWDPIKYEDLHNVTQIECGFYTSCAISKNSAVFWGEDCASLTGNGSFSGNYSLDIADIQKLSIGRNHMVVVTKDEVLGYGSNAFDQLGPQMDDIVRGEAIPIEAVEDVRCSVTATMFLIRGKTYYLGDMNPFDSQPKKSVLTRCDNSGDSVRMMDCFSFQFTEASKYHVYSFDFHAENTTEKRADKSVIALLDTGVDDHLPIVKSVLANTNSTDLGYREISKWNCCDGNDNMVDDVLTDSHGTGMLGLIVDSYQQHNADKNNLEILPVKIMNDNGGRFIDLLTAIEIVNSKNIPLVNGSFSIENEYYRNAFDYSIRASKAFYILALNNNKNASQVVLDEDNVLYVCEANFDKSNSNTFILDIGVVNIIAVGGDYINARGNSCATAITTGLLCSLSENNPEFQWTTKNVISMLEKERS